MELKLIIARIEKILYKGFLHKAENQMWFICSQFSEPVPIVEYDIFARQVDPKSDKEVVLISTLKGEYCNNMVCKVDFDTLVFEITKTYTPFETSNYLQIGSGVVFNNSKKRYEYE